MSVVLSLAEIQTRLQSFSHWSLQGNCLQSKIVFKDFIEAVAFVNRLVEPAEAAAHHPDIAISYNAVTVSLSTHDAGGITTKDFALAAAIDALRS